MGKEITEKLLGKTLEECKKIMESSKDGNALLDKMNSILFARRINMHGNALGDEFGTTLIAKDSQLIDVDIKSEAENLIQKLEELR
jgi:ssDNA-binding replication factor A large subunit